MSQSSDNGPPSAVFLERMWLDGAMVAGVGYGCNVSLFFHGCFLLYPTWKKSRINRFLLVYLIVLFLLATIFTSTKFKSTELAFVDHRDSPGGPTQYQLFSADAGATVNAVTYVISNWLADAVLLWRCYVIYKSSQAYLWAVMLLPGLMLLGTIGTGIMYAISASRPGFVPVTPIIYSASSVGMNIVCTILIVGRISLYRSRLKAAGQEGKQYTDIVAILVESAALFCAASIFYLITFGLGSPVVVLASQLVGQTQVMSAMLVIVRVAQGKAWRDDIGSNFQNTDSNTSSQPARIRTVPRMTFADRSRSEYGLESFPTEDHHSKESGFKYPVASV